VIAKKGPVMSAVDCKTVDEPIPEAIEAVV